MKEFMLIFRNSSPAADTPSPEQMQERMYTETDIDKAKTHYEKAIDLTASRREKNTFESVLKKLKA